MDALPPEIQEPVKKNAPQTGLRAVVGGLFRDLAGTVIPAILIAVLIHVFLAQATRVYGQSMEPNFHTDERLVVEKFSYRLHAPQRGDVVVIEDPSGGPELLIKRVIGLPGEHVTVAEGRVFVDGQMLDEPYLDQPTRGQGSSWVVPPLAVFVMGDNRGASRDSRVFGPVQLNEIVGRAVLRYWPLNEIGIIH